MSMYIHGIAASQNIDSAGERIIVEGMDISSLAVDGVFTFEHDAATDAKGQKINIKMPSNTVGKILKAKKIFSEKDCTDEHEAYFWSKVQVPYIYVMGELFDEFKESAKDVAGMFAYDESKKGKQERNVMNFSVEGSYIARNGMDVIRSVARKVTITVLPCNKAAIAEMVAAPGQRVKDDIDSLFKTEAVEIEIVKFDKKSELQAKILKLNMQKAESNKSHLKVVSPGGTKIGTTKSGKDVYSHGLVHEYEGFTAQDHREAATHHYEAAKKAKADVYARHHRQKADLHQSKANTISDREKRTGLSKAMEAGSGLAASPAKQTQGAALANQPAMKPIASTNVSRPNNGHGRIIHKPGTQPKPGFGKIIQKSEAYKKAEELYKSWDKKEAFESFMQKRMPHLHKGEIEAFGKALVFKKTEHKDAIPGGLADKKKPKDFDQEALKEGIKIELEHTSDHAIAQEIAMDHLTEDRHYYKKLKTIEKQERPAFLQYDKDGQSSFINKKEK